MIGAVSHAQHVGFGTQELDKRQDIPGDPYGMKKEVKLRGFPGFHKEPWIHNVTEVQLKSMVGTGNWLLRQCNCIISIETAARHSSAHAVQAPSWHGYFVFKHTASCQGCEQALSVVNSIAHRAYQDHELRMCATFAVVDTRFETPSEIPTAEQLLSSARRPSLFWIPPLHEHHAVHDKPMVR